MSNIFQQGIPSVGTGILLPKLRYRFRLGFFESNGNFDSLIEEMLPISLQVINFNASEALIDSMYDSMYESKHYPVYFLIEDDVNSLAVKAVIKRFKMDSDFDAALQILDGSETVIEEIRYKNCKFLSMQFEDSYSYEKVSNNDTYSVKIDAKKIVGSAIEGNEEGKELLQILEAFVNNLSITIPNPSYSRPSVRRQVSMNYQSMENYFPEISQKS